MIQALKRILLNFQHYGPSGISSYGLDDSLSGLQTRKESNNPSTMVMDKVGPNLLPTSDKSLVVGMMGTACATGLAETNLLVLLQFLLSMGIYRNMLLQVFV